GGTVGTATRAEIASLHPRAVLAVGVGRKALAAQLRGTRVVTGPAAPAATRSFPPLGPMPLLDLLNYRGVEGEHLGGHPAGRTADLACLAEGVLRGRALEDPVGLPQAPGAVVKLAADLRGHRRHELLDLHGCLCALTDDAAPHVLEDLDEG